MNLPTMGEDVAGYILVFASHFTDNPASGNVLRKLGFQNTGETALRHSNGRREAMTSALYERALDEADAEPRARLSPPVFNMREQMERLQAA